MKKLRTVLVILAAFALCYFGARLIRDRSVVDEVIELTSDHFIVSFKGIPLVEGQAVAEVLEMNYERIRTHLNDPEHETIRVYVHPTQDDFNQGTGLVGSNANGTSRGPNEFHFVWTNWFNSFFPDDPLMTAVHEFTHCVQLNILIEECKSQWKDLDEAGFNKAFEEKFINEYPQWFWEAICDYEARMVSTIAVKYGMSKNPTLKALNNSNQIYNVGYTIVEYIVTKWGEDKLPDLIRTYVDMESVLGVSEAEFEKGWIEFVDARY